MVKARKTKKPLVTSDFAGEGEPYTEVTVTISIRILGAGITRSRLAVNVCPDPALEPMARKSLKVLEKEHFGINEHGHFGVVYRTTPMAGRTWTRAIQESKRRETAGTTGSA